MTLTAPNRIAKTYFGSQIWLRSLRQDKTPKTLTMLKSASISLKGPILSKHGFFHDNRGIGAMKL